MLRDEILKHIEHMNYSLKEGQELEMTLKAKLTKKEYKTLKAWAENSSIDVLKLKLKLDDTRYNELSRKLIKKLNREQIKQALSLLAI